MYNEIQLEKIKLAFTEKLSRLAFAELSEAEVRFEEIADDFIRNQLTMVVQGYLWGESGPTQTISYPETWWDAFKERWFPQWLLSRYPIRYRHHEISLKTLYPHFRISMPRETHVLKYQVLDYSDSSTAMLN